MKINWTALLLTASTVTHAAATAPPKAPPANPTKNNDSDGTERLKGPLLPTFAKRVRLRVQRLIASPNSVVAASVVVDEPSVAQHT